MGERTRGVRAKALLDTLVTTAVGVAAVFVIWRSWNEPGEANQQVPRRGPPAFEDIATAGLTTSIAGAPAVGSEMAPVVLIEYSDFECPFCARHATETYDLISDEFVSKGKVQYVFRDYPIEQIHPSAVKAAQAAACAHNQGKFMEMRTHLFMNQRALAQMDWLQTASELQLGVDDFETCLGADAADLRPETREAARLGVSSTPTFFLGRRLKDGRVAVIYKLSGAAPYGTFREQLQQPIRGPNSIAGG